MTAKEKCPACKGKKQVQGYYTVGLIDCPTCQGTGLAPKPVEEQGAESE